MILQPSKMKGDQDKSIGGQCGNAVPPEYRRRSIKVKTTLVGAAFALLFVQIYYFDLFQLWELPSSQEVPIVEGHEAGVDVCLDPACVHASSEILYNLSPEYKNLDPCDNFEELVCGGWRDRHDLRPDQGDAFTGTIMFESSQTLLRHILEAPYPKLSTHSVFSPAQLDTSASSADEENFEKLKAAYDACLDEGTIKKIGAAPLLDVLRSIPAVFSSGVSEPSDSSFKLSSLSDTILYLARSGVTALVSVNTGADDKDPDTVIVSVSPPYAIGLPAKELYKDTKILERYQKVLSSVISGLFADEHIGNETFGAVVELERKLANASPDAEDRNDVTKYYNPMSLSEADELVPQIGLSKLIDGFAPSHYKTKDVIVMSPSYMKELKQILSESSKDALRVYFLWKAIQDFSRFIEADALSSYKRFTNELSGKDPDSTPERWRTCVNHVDSGLGWILSRFFVEEAFSAKAKSFGDQIVSDIKALFIEKLKATTWMEDSVTELAINKVHNIIQKIGYPTKSPDIMDPPTLRKYYDSVDVTRSTFFENALSMARLDVDKQWSALGKPVDRDEWGMSVPTVNAYYNPPGNEIVFPAGIMQFPVFDVNVPAFVSYGAFGSVSGHELSHAFDSTGRHYDENGNYTDWWTDNTVSNFTSRAECFVSQYSNFTLEGTNEQTLHVNGRLTLGENIADAGGVSAAFAAWKRRAAEVPNQNLPGLEFFTQEQLFFVSYANWWCGKSTTETAENRIYTDPHAPKWARIIGTMANSRDFRDSFACKAKEPVCELW